jgi:adenylate kinase family enzyme
MIGNKIDSNKKLFIICGPSCAGKTTLGQYLRAHHGYIHIEASDYMNLSYINSGVYENLDIATYAEIVLKEKPEIVAEQIINDLQDFQEDPIVITGFRTPDEFDWFTKNFDSKSSVELVLLDANLKLRYERSIIRGREKEIKTKEDFEIKDNQQSRMGLQIFKIKYQEKLIFNNKSLESLFNAFEAKYKQFL